MNNLFLCLEKEGQSPLVLSNESSHLPRLPSFSPLPSGSQDPLCAPAENVRKALLERIEDLKQEMERIAVSNFNKKEISCQADVVDFTVVSKILRYFRSDFRKLDITKQAWDS